MNTYSGLPPCATNECSFGSDQIADKQLCKNIHELIIEAGGAATFGVTACPVEALMLLGPESIDERHNRVRQNLGIVSYEDSVDTE